MNKIQWLQNLLRSMFVIYSIYVGVAQTLSIPGNLIRLIRFNNILIFAPVKLTSNMTNNYLVDDIGISYALYRAL